MDCVGIQRNQDDDAICNLQYGCDDDNISLGIRTIRSSETIVSEYITADQIKSRDAPATESKPKNHVDLLYTMAQDFDSGNNHFVEDRLREAIGWLALLKKKALAEDFVWVSLQASGWASLSASGWTSCNDYASQSILISF